MKTIIEMAEEAGFEITHNMILIKGWEINPYMQRFAELLRADEREACAKAADEHMRECEGKSFGVGAAIRARGNT